MADQDIEQAADEAAKATDPFDTTAEMSEEDKRKAMTEIYTKAESMLKEAHKAEFNEMRKKLAAERGIEWSPRPTAADRAEEQVRKLISENPSLAARLGIPDTPAEE